MSGPSDLWKAAMEQKAYRAARLPSEDDCFEALSDAFLRLRDLGWNDIPYCPKDGTPFQAITYGKPFECIYMGEWPEGSWWALDGGDLWPAHPIFFKKAEANHDQ